MEGPSNNTARHNSVLDQMAAEGGKWSDSRCISEEQSIGFAYKLTWDETPRCLAQITEMMKLPTT